MFDERKALYRRLEEMRGARVLAYVTSDRHNMASQIGSDVIGLFAEHLDAIRGNDRVSLYLYTRGGDTLATWNLVNLIRQHAGYLEVIVFMRALSGGTLICLGADRIVMSEQATLGPIDPSVMTALNPQKPGSAERVLVSVEDLTGFVEFCRQELGGQADLKDLLGILSNNIHPLVLGRAFRAHGQIRMLARKLLAHQNLSEDKTEETLKFLCSDSGSHDYTIHRQEAIDQLGLNIEKADDDLYAVIRDIHLDISAELELATPFNPQNLLGQEKHKSYSAVRALVESIAGGSHHWSTQGRLELVETQPQKGQFRREITDTRSFEGWKHSAS